jgi:hypothetical protein
VNLTSFGRRQYACAKRPGQPHQRATRQQH